MGKGAWLVFMLLGASGPWQALEKRCYYGGEDLISPSTTYVIHM